MSRILVTGAEGFLGKEVVKILQKNKYEFIGITRKKARENFHLCDLSIPNDIFKLLDNTKPDVIINLAASVDFNNRDSKLFFPVNVMLPTILANYCEDNNIFLVHSSGIIVHGFSHALYNVKTKLTPDTTYGRSKLLADKIIESSGCKYSILRLGGVYGDNGPSHLGINKTINNAKKGELPKIIGEGIAKRNYIYVKDVAKAILKCFEDRVTGVHYCGGEIKTIKDMLINICEVFMPDATPDYIHGEEAEDQLIENSSHFSITSFKEALLQIK